MPACACDLPLDLVAKAGPFTIVGIGMGWVLSWGSLLGSGLTYGLVFMGLILAILLARFLPTQTDIRVSHDKRSLGLRSRFGILLTNGSPAGNRFLVRHFISPVEALQKAAQLWTPGYNVIECEG